MKNTFRLVNNYEVAKEAWDILKTTHEGTSRVKMSRLQLLTSKFENLRMKEDEVYFRFLSAQQQLLLHTALILCSIVFLLNEFVWPITTNQLANLQFSWVSWLMVNHKCIRWWILKCPLWNLINWWDSLLEKLLKIPSQTRVSKANPSKLLKNTLSI